MSQTRRRRALGVELSPRRSDRAARRRWPGRGAATAWCRSRRRSPAVSWSWATTWCCGSPTRCWRRRRWRELDPLDRQALHARLVDVVDDPDQRARHLALSCAEPDAAVAEELGQAAMRASRRGASALAAELAGHCLRVTPPADLALRARRWLVAILHRATAGEKTRALAELDELIGLLPSGPLRARGDRTAGGDRLRFRRPVPRTGTRGGRRRRTAAGPDPRAVRLGGRHLPRRAAAEGLELAEQALAIARRRDDPGLEMIAASSVATAGLLVGTATARLDGTSPRARRVAHRSTPREVAAGRRGSSVPVGRPVGRRRAGTSRTFTQVPPVGDGVPDDRSGCSTSPISRSPAGISPSPPSWPTTASRRPTTPATTQAARVAQLPGGNRRLPSR